MKLELRSYEQDDEGDQLTNDTSAEEKKQPNADYDEAIISLAKDDDDENEMRGVHAIEDIAPNSVCVEVPRKCLITVEMGKATDIGELILKSDVDLDAPKHVFLMIFLLLDRKDPESFFKPYYDILPQTLRNMPIFWDDEELSCLEGSHLLHQVSARIYCIVLCVLLCL